MCALLAWVWVSGLGVNVCMVVGGNVGECVGVRVVLPVRAYTCVCVCVCANAQFRDSCKMPNKTISRRN